MKIAILFSGRLDRSDEHHNNLLRQIVQEHDTDVFVSTIADQEKLEQFCELYHPISIVNEPIQYNPSFESNRHPLCNYHNMMCMYCHRWRVFHEMDTYARLSHTHYDMVLSLRLDIYHDQQLDYAMFNVWSEGLGAARPSTTNDRGPFTPGVVLHKFNGIWIPEGNDWGGINDQMAVGDVEAMRIYMNVWTNIDPWISLPNFGPEIILGQHLAQHDVIVHRFQHAYRLINGKYYQHFSDPIMK